MDLARLERAHERLRSLVRKSPVTNSPGLSALAGRQIWLKHENLQVTGSFKERGAAIKLLALDQQQRERGVVCASAGNHAQGVAFHASRLQIPATIVMPERTPLIKVQNTKRYGARVLLHGSSFDDAQREARRIEQEEQLVFVHPFDDDDVIAGQASVGLEILEQIPEVDTVVVAVGGGGLAAGVGLALKAHKPSARLIGVEMQQLASMKAALLAGAPVSLEPAQTLSEGIAVRTVGARTFALAQQLLDEVVTVDDEEVAAAILFLLEQEKTVAEGAGAATVAALLQGRSTKLGEHVALVISGGNIDVNVVSRIIERGLARSGRLVRLLIDIPDVFGALAGLTGLLAESRANIVQIHHERAFQPDSSGRAVVEVVLETRGFEHAAEVQQRLQGAGYRLRS